MQGFVSQLMHITSHWNLIFGYTTINWDKVLNEGLHVICASCRWIIKMFPTYFDFKKKKTTLIVHENRLRRDDLLK